MVIAHHVRVAETKVERLNGGIASDMLDEEEGETHQRGKPTWALAINTPNKCLIDWLHW